jgi:hypothetical protein
MQIDLKCSQVDVHAVRQADMHVVGACHTGCLYNEALSCTRCSRQTTRTLHQTNSMLEWGRHQRHSRSPVDGAAAEQLALVAGPVAHLPILPCHPLLVPLQCHQHIFKIPPLCSLPTPHCHQNCTNACDAAS